MWEVRCNLRARGERERPSMSLYKSSSFSDLLTAEARENHTSLPNRLATSSSIAPRYPIDRENKVGSLTFGRATHPLEFQHLRLDISHFLVSLFSTFSGILHPLFLHFTIPSITFFKFHLRNSEQTFNSIFFRVANDK